MVSGMSTDSLTYPTAPDYGVYLKQFTEPEPNPVRKPCYKGYKVPCGVTRREARRERKTHKLNRKVMMEHESLPSVPGGADYRNRCRRRAGH